jgi:hypothetical protein
MFLTESTSFTILILTNLNSNIRNPVSDINLLYSNHCQRAFRYSNNRAKVEIILILKFHNTIIFNEYIEVKSSLNKKPCNSKLLRSFKHSTFAHVLCLKHFILS